MEESKNVQPFQRFTMANRRETGNRSLVVVPPDEHLGPAMRELTEPQRRYVIALIETGARSKIEAARLAGYGPAHGTAAAASWRLSTNPKVLAAVREEADKRIRGNALLGASILEEMASDPMLDPKVRLKVATELLNRAGLVVATEHKVAVEHRVDEATILERAKRVAASLGIDQKQLLGRAAKAGVIDAEFEVVQPDEEYSTEGLEDLL